MNDPAQAYAALRVETAQMLNLDLADLSLVAGLQLDLVSLLRLEVDGLQGSALAGASIDLDRLSVALGMLQKLLPAQALVSTPPPSETTRFGPDHRARLKELVERTVLRPVEDDPGEVARLVDSQQREEACMASEAAGEPPEPAALAGTRPVPPQPSGAVSHQPPLPRDGAIPANYLRDTQRREEWWDGGAGNVTWFRPHG